MAIDRLKILLSKGYFPQELPATFTTENFGKNSRDILDEWSKSKYIPSDYKTNKKFTTSVVDTEAESWSLPKNIYERRDIFITHPMSQALLSYTISKNWKTISSWINRSIYSIDNVEVKEKSDRAIPNPSFDKHQIHKEKIESFSNWIVKTDITRFYPSIYTHSIPWAAYGKEKVKKNLGRYNHSLADQLDTLVRKCNRNQTIGIPIGPDTSRVLAEIVSSRIDSNVNASLSLNKLSVDRLQDDWLVGCESLETAEESLSKIRIEYQKFGLDINGSKTSIVQLAKQEYPSWVGQIRFYLNYKKLSGKILSDLCKEALSLQIKNPEEKVLNYLLASFYNKNFSDEDIYIIESFLLKAVVVNPKITDVVCKLILNYIDEGRPISIDRVKLRFIPFVENALKNNWHFEATWGLYLLRGLKINLKIPDIVSLSRNYEGAVVPLILLDMKDKGFVSKLPISSWERRIKQTDYHDWSWLLAYEGVRHNWLKSKDVKKHDLFKPFFKRSVVFYDESRNVKTRAAIVKERRKKFKISKRFLYWYLTGNQSL